jgi:hypothetical protein
VWKLVFYPKESTKIEGAEENVPKREAVNRLKRRA